MATAPGWFWPALGVVTLLGAAGWLLYALAIDIGRLPFNDARNFHLLADGLADGVGYVRPVDRVDGGLLVATAEYPPLFPALLAIASLFGLDTFTAHQGVAAVVAATAIPLTGLLGRRLGGPSVGLVAATLVAVHPMLFQTGAAMMSEALYLPLVVAVLLVTLRARDAGTWRWWALAGLLAGAAALTRGEGLVLGAIVAVVAAADQHRADRRRALVHAGAVVAGLLLLVVPWSVERSAATGGPVLVSANQQTVLAGANCDATYEEGFRGWWAFNCFADALRPGDDEADRYRALTSTAIDHAREHPAQLPGVAAVRVLRVWGLHDVDEQLAWEATEGRRSGVQRVGWATTLLLAPLAAAGVAVLRRRRGPWVLLLAPVVMVTATAATTYGNQRFRIAAEPSLILLAALALVTLARRPASRARPVPGRGWGRPAPARPVTGDPAASGGGETVADRRNVRLEGLRALAAFLVVGTHVGFASGATFRTGVGAYLARMDVGVAIFFVLSGYLLFRPFVRADLQHRPAPHVPGYLWRRTLRIVPAYWLALAAIPVLLGIEKVRNTTDLVVYGGFLQIYDQDRALGGITQAWSLCTEVSFYIALPVYAAVLRRTGGGRVRSHVLGLAVLYAASVLFRAWLQIGDPSIAPIAWAWLPANADLFALGMAVAVVEVGGGDGVGRVRDVLRRHGRWCLPAAAVVFWVVSTGLDLPRGLDETTAAQELARHFLYGLVGVLAVTPLALGARGDRIGAALGWRPVVWLGTISYGVYVWHLDVVGAAVDWLDGSIGDTPAIDLVALAVPLAILVAAGSWYLLERPLLRLRDAVGARPAAAGGARPSIAAIEEQAVAPAERVPW